MRFAWAASIAAQALLALTLYRAGQRDWWTAYLALDIIRSAALWSLSGLAYYWVYTLPQPVLMYAQFMAVQQLSPRGPWMLTRVYSASAVSAWVVALSPQDWPIARYASIMLWQGTALVCLAVLLGGRAAVDTMVKAYYVLGSISAVAAQMVTTPEWSVLVSTVHLASLSVLFILSTCAKYPFGLRANA